MKTAEEAYEEAIKGINIQENENIVLKIKDHHYSYLFARDVPRANIKSHEKIILESKDLYCCYWFAKDVKESNKEYLFKVVLESGNKNYISAFLKYIDFNKDKYINYLLFI